MTRKEALTELLANTENGIWIPETKIYVWELNTDLLWKAYSGSLDAAKALHEAVLPGWFYLIGFGPKGFGTAVSKSKSEPNYEGSADTNARAWLIAIIKALIAEEQDNG